MPPLSGALGCIFVKGVINGELEAYVDRKYQVAGTYPGPEIFQVHVVPAIPSAMSTSGQSSFY